MQELNTIIALKHTDDGEFTIIDLVEVNELGECAIVHVKDEKTVEREAFDINELHEYLVSGPKTVNGEQVYYIFTQEGIDWLRERGVNIVVENNTASPVAFEQQARDNTLHILNQESANVDCVVRKETNTFIVCLRNAEFRSLFLISDDGHFSVCDRDEMEARIADWVQRNKNIVRVSVCVTGRGTVWLSFFDTEKAIALPAFIAKKHHHKRWFMYKVAALENKLLVQTSEATQNSSVRINKSDSDEVQEFYFGFAQIFDRTRKKLGFAYRVDENDDLHIMPHREFCDMLLDNYVTFYHDDTFDAEMTERAQIIHRLLALCDRDWARRVMYHVYFDVFEKRDDELYQLITDLRLYLNYNANAERALYALAKHALDKHRAENELAMWAL